MTVPTVEEVIKKISRLLILKNKFEIEGQIVSIQYDPYRSAFIALIEIH